MIAPALLLLYAVVVGSAGAHQLAKARWPNRSPRLGIRTWQALTGSVVLAAVLAGATLAVPSLPVTRSLAGLLDACQQAILAQYAKPGGAVAASSGAVLGLTVIARLGVVLAAECIVTSRRRCEQRRGLLLVADRLAVTGAHVVPHAAPAAYCLPGRTGIVVLTSSAVATLEDCQLSAVLAHEHAHLRLRHCRILTVADALRKAFPFVPAFVVANTQLRHLVELQADDAASRHHDRRVLATALVTLAHGAVPTVAMGAGGGSALARVRRLATPANPLGLGWSMLVSGAASTMLILPMITAAGPAVAAAVLDYCPLGFPLLNR